mgnify:CR=1 FL=1
MATPPLKPNYYRETLPIADIRLTIPDRHAREHPELNTQRTRPRKPGPDDALVRVGPLMGLPRLLSDLGQDPAPVFREAGFDVRRFSDPDSKVPFIPASRLLARCVAATDCDQLGLLLGKHAEPSSLGVAGFMLRSAPDVRTALEGLVQHLALHDQGGDIVLKTRGDRTIFGYAIHLPGVQATDQIYDLSVTITVKIMRSLCGADWHPDEILLSRRAPSDLAPYRAFFQAPLRFESSHNAIVFSRNWLFLPVPGADPLLHRHLEREAETLHARQQAGLVNELRRVIANSLGTQHSTVTEIASQLHLHERTLNRRLREHGTSFRQELEHVRYDVACRLLAKSDMPLSAIAARLDYLDASAFIRAFKRWSGHPPALWRKVHDRT